MRFFRIIFYVFLLLLVTGCKEEFELVFNEEEMNKISENFALKLVDGDYEYVYENIAEVSRKSTTYENMEIYFNKIFLNQGKFEYVISNVFVESRNPLSKVPEGTSTVKLKYEKGIITCVLKYDESKILGSILLTFELR